VRIVGSARAEYEQRTVGELAEAAGRDPLDFMLDFALEENLDTVFSALLLNSDEKRWERCSAIPARWSRSPTPART